MKSRRGILGGGALRRQTDDFLAFCRRDIRAEKFFRRMYADAATIERKRLWSALWVKYRNKYHKKGVQS